MVSSAANELSLLSEFISFWLFELLFFNTNNTKITIIATTGTAIVVTLFQLAYEVFTFLASWPSNTCCFKSTEMKLFAESMLIESFAFDENLQALMTSLCVSFAAFCPFI